MNLLFDNSTSYEFDDDLVSTIEECISKTIEYENINYDENIEKINFEISLSIVNNEEIREINKLHRNIDKETDVLSFPLIDFTILPTSAQEKKEDEVSSIFQNFSNISNYPLQALALGDIIISIERVLSQAIEYNHSVKREVCFLVVHSMLHLLGYDHMTPNEEKTMIEKQKDILNSLGITR